MPKKTLDKDQTELIAQRLKEVFGNDTTNEICAKVGNVTASSVNFWKNGTNRPDYDTLIRICDAYDVSSDWILGRKGAVKKAEKGIQAACDATGLSEEAINAISGTKFKRELDFLLRDTNLTALLKSCFRIATYLYNMRQIEAEINALEEGKDNDLYIEQKRTSLFEKYRESMEKVEFSRFRLAEEAVKSAESIYGISREIKHAERELEKLDHEICSR